MLLKIIFLPFRVALALPALMVTGTVWMLAELVLHIGSLAYTVFSLFILYVIFRELMIHEWVMAGVVFALEMAVTFVFFGATAITILLEGINGKLFGFILG